MSPVDCNCPSCRSMCANSVCVPTPDEARELIRLYPGRMARYEFPAGRVVAPAMKGKSGTQSQTRGGECVFYGPNGCELHGKGKPLEGRLAHHSRHWLSVRMEVMGHWRGKRYESVAAMLERNT